MRLVYVVAFALTVLPACDGEAAKEKVKQKLAALSDTYDEAQAALHAEQLVDAVKSCDRQQLKRLCTEVGNVEYRSIMSCYYEAFILEDSKGAGTAREFLAGEMRRDGISPSKMKALHALDEYFAMKGTLKTREAVGLVLVVGLEVQFPHAGGIVGSAIARKLGLLDVNASSGPPVPAPAVGTGTQVVPSAPQGEQPRSERAEEE